MHFRAGCEEQYGDIRVRAVSEVKYANYTQRLLSMYKQQEQRQIIQFQYTEWACYGAPVKVNLFCLTF
jgi:Protein-tyrosine phosphatase